MTLNIEENIKILVIKALNKYKYKKEAAKALGMTERNLFVLINKYKLRIRKNTYITHEQQSRKETAKAGSPFNTNKTTRN